MGALDLRLGLVPLIAVLVPSCDGDGVAFDVRVPVDPPVRPLPELAFWRSSGGIAIARTDRTGTVRSRNLGLGDVRRFFVDRVAWSPDGRRLAFTGEAGLGYRQRDIWTVDGHGGRLRRATRTGDALWPVWAPDGRSIVYARLDGGNPRRLKDPTPGVTERAWSFAPDGSQLAITRARLPALERRAKRTRLVLVNLDGSGERALSGTGTDPAFSPDGSRIAYASARDRNGTLNYGDLTSIATELYVMDADGTGRRRLTRTRSVNELAPSWSPNGATLAYTRGQPYQNAEIYSIWHVNPDGSCPASLLTGRPRGNWYASPVWRPGRATRQPGRLRC